MRSDQFDIRITVDGELLGTFDTCSGGETDSEETRYKPGGMAPEVSLGGSATVGAITVGRLMDQARNDTTTAKRLMGRAGKAEMVVVKQPLDKNGAPYGDPFTYRGVLKTVTLPDHDSRSSEPAVWTLVMTPEGNVT